MATHPKPITKKLFLEELASDDCFGIQQAAARAEVHHETIRVWRKEDAAFDAEVKRIRYGWEERAGERGVERLAEVVFNGAPYEAVVKGGKDSPDEVMVLRKHDQRALDRWLDRYAGFGDKLAGQRIQEKVVKFTDREGKQFSLTEIIRQGFTAARSEFLDLAEAEVDPEAPREVEVEHGSGRDDEGRGGALPDGGEGGRVPE